MLLVNSPWDTAGNVDIEVVTSINSVVVDSNNTFEAVNNVSYPEPLAETKDSVVLNCSNSSTLDPTVLGWQNQLEQMKTAPVTLLRTLNIS